MHVISFFTLPHESAIFPLNRHNYHSRKPKQYQNYRDHREERPVVRDNRRRTGGRGNHHAPSRQYYPSKRSRDDTNQTPIGGRYPNNTSNNRGPRSTGSNRGGYNNSPAHYRSVDGGFRLLFVFFFQPLFFAHSLTIARRPLCSRDFPQ